MEAETKTCCVTGHRDIPAEKKGLVEEALRREVAAAIEDGYTRFISGFAEGADLMFATICFLQALFPQKCRLTSSKLHGEFPHYCISSSGTLSGAGEESLQAYKVY